MNAGILLGIMSLGLLICGDFAIVHDSVLLVILQLDEGRVSFVFGLNRNGKEERAVF